MRAVPVDALGRRADDVEQCSDLTAFVMSPGRVTGLGDPDFRFGAVLQKNFADASDLGVPSIPPKFKSPWEPVNADCVDVLHHAALAHQSNPLRIHGSARPEHGLFAALLRPVRRAADHLAKN